MSDLSSHSLDHRTRVGQERRQKTLEKLVEAAVMVFAERGLKGTVVDHVVSRAGVSRGTFYNYFDTVEEALEAARVALGREVVLLVKSVIDINGPPEERVAYGLRAFVEIACNNTLFLEFTARLGRRSYSFASVLCETGPGFISDGIEAGVFRPIPETLILDMLETGTIAMLRRVMAGEDVDVEAFVAAMLRVFGLPYDRSVALATRPVTLPEVPEDSLLARGDAAFRRAS